MFTRADYMAGRCDHHTYYAQFVNEATIAHVLAAIPLKEIRASTDPYLNDIGLVRWDEAVGRLPLAVRGRDLDPCFGSMSDYVCIAKTAARIAAVR